MALTHTIIETRPYLSKHLLILEIRDTDTGLIYVRRSMFHKKPTLDQQNAQAKIEMERIQLQIDMDANPLNAVLNAIDDEAVKTELVSRIRQNPFESKLDSETNLSNKCPESLLDFGKLYDRLIEESDCKMWKDLTDYIADHKFEGVD